MMDLFSRLKEMAEDPIEPVVPEIDAEKYASFAEQEPVEEVKESKPVNHVLNKQADMIVDGLKKLAFSADDDVLLDASAVEMLKKALDGKGIN